MILVINTGSSSLKAKLFDSESLKLIEKFSYPNLNSNHSHKKAALELSGSIEKYTYGLKTIAHRIVSGGEGAKNGEAVSAAVLKRLKASCKLDPLHNPPAIAVIEIMKKRFPKIPNVLAHDIAFYSTLPETEYTYPINKNVSSKLGIRKFGFHGISHQYAYDQAGKDYEKVVSVHLGAGCSVTAIYKGRAISTSMGLTPQGGVAMQTRSGDLDPGVIFAIASKYGLKFTKDLIENNSGLKGLTGTNGDMLTLLHLSGNPVEDETFTCNTKASDELKRESQLAIDIFCQRVRDFIGAYAARMGGVDSIIFTGKIGYGSKYIRDKITFGLDYLNLIEVSSVDPDEELAIATIITK